MPAPKKNKYWQLRETHGRKRIFETPEDLWNGCVEYFEWVEANPLYEEKLFAYQGEITSGTIAKMRAMTKTGLCLFLEISEQTWLDYAKRKDFIDVTTRAERIIYAQKFEGASADLLNPNIIARDLGLKEKVEETGDHVVTIKRQIIRGDNS